MKIGIVLPHHEIGADPGAMKALPLARKNSAQITS